MLTPVTSSSTVTWRSPLQSPEQLRTTKDTTIEPSAATTARLFPAASKARAFELGGVCGPGRSSAVLSVRIAEAAMRNVHMYSTPAGSDALDDPGSTKARRVLTPTNVVTIVLSLAPLSRHVPRSRANTSGSNVTSLEVATTFAPEGVSKTATATASPGPPMLEPISMCTRGVGVGVNSAFSRRSPAAHTDLAGSTKASAPRWHPWRWKRRGSVDVESQVGRGSSFRIWLPRDGSRPREPG